jgi:hypothetical protein
MNCSIASCIAWPVRIGRSPASTRISGGKSIPLSLRNAEASEKSAARIKGGASLDPRKNDEFSSQGMPASAIVLCTMTFSLQNSVLSSRAQSRNPMEWPQSRVPEPVSATRQDPSTALRSTRDDEAIRANAVCLTISARACSSNSRPGGMRCQGDAPDGCGSGMRSNLSPARSTRKRRPMISSSRALGRNCAMASFPTGMTSRGCRISSSRFNQDEQFSISCGLGTRSLPPGALPGKQRQTAAK